MGTFLSPQAQEEFYRFAADVGAFMDDPDHAPNPAWAVAVLVREAAVAAFVRGAMWCGGPVPPLPSDTEMLRQARETARHYPGLYPAWGVLERNA